MRADRDLIRKLYVEDELSTVQIAEQLNSTPGAINSVLRFLGIPRRTPLEGFRKRFPNGRFGDKSARWKGGKRKTSKGYIYVYTPEHPNTSKEGYVMEHRLVMEKHLGRYLEKFEMVHHKNRNKADNRIENLELVSNHKEHSHKYFSAAEENDRLKQLLRRHHICSFHEILMPKSVGWYGEKWECHTCLSEHRQPNGE